MITVFDDVSFVQAMLDFERALSAAEAENGIIEDDAAEIPRFADDRRVTRPVEVIMHLIHQTRDFGPQNLNRDRINHRDHVRVEDCRSDLHSRASPGAPR